MKYEIELHSQFYLLFSGPLEELVLMDFSITNKKAIIFKSILEYEIVKDLPVDYSIAHYLIK